MLQTRSALKELRKSLSGDEALGVDVFSSALSSPPYWIATNAGPDGSVVVNKVSELGPGHGLNAATLSYGDLVADGVIEPGEGDPIDRRRPISRTGGWAFVVGWIRQAVRRMPRLSSNSRSDSDRPPQMP
jgi:hypothetical protein